MTDIKGMLASRTVWSGIIGFLAVLAGAFGVNFGVENEAVVAAVIKVVEGLSFLAAIFFRVVATARIA